MRILLALATFLCILFTSCNKSDTQPVVLSINEGLITFSGESNPDSNDIFIIHPDGRGLQRITNFPGKTSTQPCLSYDRKKIVFTSDKDWISGTGSNDIYVIDIDGKNLKRLTNSSRYEMHPQFSPDGTKIAFSAPDNNQNDQIFVMNADGTNEIQLTNYTDPARTIYSEACSWSKDGTKILFHSNKDTQEYDIYTISPNGTNLKNITNTPGKSEFFPSLSPDATQITFITGNTSHDNEIWIIKSDGTGLKQLTNFTTTVPNAVSGDPSWSPDGTRIVFNSSKDKPTTALYDIYTIKTDGTDLKRLTSFDLIKFYCDWK